MRRKRVLSREERWLWNKVAGSYEPLKGKTLFLDPEDRTAALPPEIEAAKQAGKQKTLEALRPFHPERKPPEHAKPSRAAVLARAEHTRMPPLAQMERKTVRSLRRGAQPVDGVLDLHGMRQAEAHYALLAFLRQSQARGAAMVLVVTGKGDYDSGFHSGPDERGVLKRVVPQWLSMPEARAYVVSFGAAAQHHGGTGALYVRLRRHRG